MSPLSALCPGALCLKIIVIIGVALRANVWKKSPLLSTTCTLRLGFLRLSLGLAGVRDNRCIVLTSMVLWCHRTLCFIKDPHWTVSLTLYAPASWCEFPKNKAVFTAIAPISIEINTTFLYGWRQWRPHFFVSFYLWGWVLSLLCKITSISCILQCQLYNFFGGYLGCFPSLHSGFGLFWNTKQKWSLVPIFALFWQIRVPAPWAPQCHLHPHWPSLEATLGASPP